MDIVFWIAIVLHVVPGVFWAGSTFVLARGSVANPGELFGPQMGAATVTVLAGAFLWYWVYGASAGSAWLGFGALCAVVAAGVQGMLVGRARRQGGPDAAAKMLRGNRIAALLLVVTIITMVTN